jgi:hypothetical protein
MPDSPLRAIVATRVALLLAAAAAIAACCGEDYDGRVISPDERYEAFVVERDCGATTGYVTYVRLKDRKALLVRHQDIMMIDGSASLRLKWAGPRHLIIEYPPGRPPDPRRTHGPPARWEDVDITLTERAH